jgi:thiamine-phosphate pyrophosphorylase
MSMSDAGEWLRASLTRRAGLALIIDHQRSALPLGEAIEQALTVGIELVQLRERDLPPEELLRIAADLRTRTLARAPFVINGDVDLALAVAADGVHLPERGMSVAAARARLGRGCLVGRSVHSVDAARAAATEGADYVQVGAIFATPSHPDRAPVGLDLVREVRAAVTLPVLAVGGITPENARGVIEAGADGVAVIGAIMGSREPGRATWELRKALAGW